MGQGARPRAALCVAWALGSRQVPATGTMRPTMGLQSFERRLERFVEGAFRGCSEAGYNLWRSEGA